MKFFKAQGENTDAVEQSPPEEATAKSSHLEDGLEMDLAAFERVTADEADDENNATGSKCRSRRSIVFCVLLACIVGIVVALSVTLTDNDSSSGSQPPRASNEEPPRSANTKLLELLKPHTPEDVLLDSNTPQGQAFIQLEEEFSEPVNEFRVLQRYALMCLYFSTTPEGWDNQSGWNTFHLDECTWHGISTCRALEDGNRAVSHIRLDTNDLDGNIPNELCILGDNLEQLDMGNNALSGPIPECFVQFTSLIRIELDDNSLSGPIPRGFFTVSSLQVVEIYRNLLSGSLDVLFESDHGSVTCPQGLTILGLDRNLFSGSVPEQLSSCVALEILRLDDNFFGGEISSDICDLTDTEGGVLAEITVDCGEVTCSCCDNCR